MTVPVRTNTRVEKVGFAPPRLVRDAIKNWVPRNATCQVSGTQFRRRQNGVNFQRGFFSLHIGVGQIDFRRQRKR
jgi:hypothetical protein